MTIENDYGSPYSGLVIDYASEEELEQHARLLQADAESKKEALKEFFSPITLEDEMEEGGQTWKCTRCGEKGIPHLYKNGGNSRIIPSGFIIPVSKCPECKHYRLGNSRNKAAQMCQDYIAANYTDKLELVPGSDTKWQRKTT